MSDATRTRRMAFIVSHEAWYWKAGQRPEIAQEIQMGDYPEGGGTYGEFSVRWHDIGRSPAPRLEVFSDAMEVFAGVAPDLVPRLAALGDRYSPEDVVQILDDLGWEDDTPRTDPHKTQATVGPCGRCGRGA